MEATGCGGLAFNPSLSLAPAETSQSDEPDGAGADLHVPQGTSEPGRPNSPDVQSAEVTLPEGMTLNPSAAHGLEACSNAEIGLGTDDPSPVQRARKWVPSRSTLPVSRRLAHGMAVRGHAGTRPGGGLNRAASFGCSWLGEAPQYGVGLRLEGRVKANPAERSADGQFQRTPRRFPGRLDVQFKGGPRAALPIRWAAVPPNRGGDHSL